ncbi:hypothetical protein [Marinobacter sp. F3R08]|uniref:hypothetical protein n=1 Tax=Marinobacter sp. F3R08 TaxID=2841559 RepID=UPI001C09274B|nr:hypothetical protein [Marinobacter sp. F3R08]MBU2952171.1 hypothetical protein [Marinobacter sp. F3R08]
MSLLNVSNHPICLLFFNRFIVQNSSRAVRKFITIFVFAFSQMTFSGVTHATGDGTTPVFLQGTVYDRVGDSEGVDPTLLYAVALAESGRAIGEQYDQVAPWPFVLRALDARYYADNERDYREAYKLFKAKYGDKFDVGPAQVNVYWQVTRAKRVGAGSDLLDVETNLTVGAQVLREAMASTEDKALGIGRYHTWSDAERARIFGERVLAVYQNLLQSQN